MNLLDLTSYEISQINKEETIVLLPIGSVEQHGPQLPVGTKCYIAETIAYEAANKFKFNEMSCLIAPTMPFMPCNTSIGFDGCYYVSARTFSDMVYEIITSFYAQGFRFISIVNMSISPEAIKGVLAAIEDLEKFEGLTVIDPMPIWNLGKSEKLAAYLKKQDINLKSELHGGATETAALLHLDETLIRSDIAKQLKPCIVNKTWEVLKGHFSFKEMGSEHGYLGSPAKATPEIGSYYLENAAQALYKAIVATKEGKQLPELPLQIRMLLKMIDLDEM